MPSPVASTGLVVTEYICPAAAACENDVGGLDALEPTFGVERDDAGAPRTFEDEIEGEPTLEDRGGAVTHRFDEGPFHFRACSGPSRVQNTRAVEWPPSLALRQPPAGAPVEHGAERDELVDALGTFVHEHANRCLVAQSSAGAEGVRQVEIG